MSLDSGGPGGTADRLASSNSGDDGDDAARIADPDDYNLARRLQQLHDAKERIVSVSENAEIVEMTDREFSRGKRDRIVASAVADFIAELRPVLELKDEAEALLDEEVSPVDGEMVTVRDYAEALGRLRYQADRDGENPLIDTSSQNWEPKTPPLEVSLMVRDICADYFEPIAGAVLVKETAAPDANPVDPGGRFGDE